MGEFKNDKNITCSHIYECGGLEVMRCGLPLVTLNIRGLKDIMKSEVSGYMCSQGDFIAFTGKLKKLRENSELCKNMGIRNK